MIEEFLKSRKITGEDGPSDWHFLQLGKIANEFKKEEICSEIMENYNPELHDRHQVACLFSMLIWQSAEHDLAVSEFFDNWESSGDMKLIGVCISNQLEWFPFKTPERTLQGIQLIMKQYPEFKEDCEYWERTAKQEIERAKHN